MSQAPGVVPPSAVAATLLRRAAWPTGVALAACWVVGALVAGGKGLLGAVVGTAVVTVFFGIDLLVMRATVRLDPVITFGLVMTEYLGKVIGLALFLAAFRGTTAFSTRVMAATLAVGTVVFLTSATIAFARMRMYSTDPGPPGT